MAQPCVDVQGQRLSDTDKVIPGCDWPDAAVPLDGGWGDAICESYRDSTGRTAWLYAGAGVLAVSDIG